MEPQILGTTEEKVPNDSDHILLELDVMLDTVMGTLGKMDPAIASKILASGKYNKRNTNRFEGVDDAAFKAAWESRDIDTLKHSVLTNMSYFLQRLIKDSLISSISQSKMELLRFTINVYPYEFDDPELVEMLIGCIRFYTYSTAEIRVISISPEQMTPQYCNSNYQIMVMRDWTGWLNHHKAFFEKQGLPQLTIVAPELFADEAPSPEELINLGFRNLNPFDETAKAVAPLFRLKFMPISLFSIHERITKENSPGIVSTVLVTEPEITAYINDNHPTAVIIKEDPLPIPVLEDLDDLF